MHLLVIYINDDYKWIVFFSVSDPYWTQYGSGSSILGQYGSGSGFGSRFLHNQIERNSFSRKLHFYFSVSNCLKDTDWGLMDSSENHKAFSKMDNTFFLLKSQIFFLFGHHLTVLNLDTDLYSQYGSGSRSRGAISIRIHMDPDPDPKHWLKGSINNSDF